MGLGWKLSATWRSRTIAENVNGLGALVFFATLALAFTTGPRAIAGFAPAGALNLAAGVMILLDFRGSARPSDDAHSLPDHPELMRYAGGSFHVIFGATLLALAVLTLAGVVADPDHVLTHGLGGASEP